MLFLGIKASLDNSGESTGETPRFSRAESSNRNVGVGILWFVSKAGTGLAAAGRVRGPD